MSTSKVTKAEFNREWESPHGMLYYHDLAFEDGVTGQYASKSKDQSKFVVGQSAEYEIAGQDKGGHNKIKPPKQEFGGGGGKRKVNVKSIHGSEAVYMAADLLANKLFHPDDHLSVEKHIYEQLQKCGQLGEEGGIHGSVAFKSTVKLVCAGTIDMDELDTVARATFKRLKEYAI